MSNAFNVPELLEIMISTAVQEITEGNWQKIQQTAEYEFGAILQRVQEIRRLRAADQISKESAERLLDNQVSLTESTLHLVRVLRKQMVRRMIDAVLNAIGSIVNRYVGLDIIQVED